MLIDTLKKLGLQRHRKTKVEICEIKIISIPFAIILVLFLATNILQAQGTYLVGHLGDNLAREYDAEGKIIHDFNAPGHVFMGQRLKNGHTLVSWQKGILEYDTAGNVVWELTEKDVPEMKLQFFLGINRLDNGNTIVCNWLGWDAKGKGIPLFEVSKDKKVVWQVPDSDKIGSISFLQVI